MANKRGYTSWLSDDAVAFVSALSKSKRQKVLGLADAIAAHPFNIGDFQTRDDAGHVVENVLVGGFLFSYWIDHAVREVRISEILRP